MAYCGEHTLQHKDQQSITAISLRCRAWTCGDCAPDRRVQLIAKAKSGNPNRLLTLTSRRRKDQTPEDAAKALVRSWRLIRRIIKRQNPRERVEFLAIFEATKLGWPHIHILVRSEWLDHHFIRAQMARLTDSPVIDIRAIKNAKGAAHYVAKYTSKGAAKFGTLKRYWTSKSYELSKWVKPKSPHGWDRQDFPLAQWSNMWSKFGYSITWQSAYKVLAEKPP